MDALDEALAATGSDVFVAIGSSDDADMRYLTRFTTTDPVIYFKRSGERGTVIVSQMEYDRAVREASVTVMTRAEAGLFEILKEEHDHWRALARLIAGLARKKILVLPQFPYALARELEGMVAIDVERAALSGMRAVKSKWEIDRIRKVQAATDAAMEKGITMIRRTRVKKGVLYRGAVPLTSGMVKAAMHRALLAHGCIALDTIVACGEDSALPHHRGEGSLEADEPIVIDLFPRDEQTGYYSDMSRTVCRGEPSSEILDMYAAVRDARDLASTMMLPGACGAEVYQAVVDFFRERGYGTGSSGFMHNLGHGVGLAVHEAPSLGPSGEVLSTGHVVTNEPGLYCKGIGGVRLENTGVIGPGGFASLTDYPDKLIV